MINDLLIQFALKVFIGTKQGLDLDLVFKPFVDI